MSIGPESFLILVINPGSTSTKVALFRNTSELSSASIVHSYSELSVFSTVAAQEPYRLVLIRDFLKENAQGQKIHGIAARGRIAAPRSKRSV
jgi:butyrate kinase